MERRIVQTASGQPRGELGYSTASSYLSVIKQVRLKWGETRISRMKPLGVQEWLKKMDAAPKTKGHVNLFVPSRDWIDTLLDSDTFKNQLKLAAGKVQAEKVDRLRISKFLIAGPARGLEPSMREFVAEHLERHSMLQAHRDDSAKTLHQSRNRRSLLAIRMKISPGCAFG